MISTERPSQLLIGGAWRAGQEEKTFDVVEPATSKVMAKAAVASPADVEHVGGGRAHRLRRWGLEQRRGERAGKGAVSDRRAHPITPRPPGHPRGAQCREADPRRA